MLDALYAAWKDDVDAGRRSLMIAGDQASVAELNDKARADRVRAGEVTGRDVPIADGAVAGVGDEVVTRRNDRSLTAGAGWVKNGDRWTVAAVHDDGALSLRRAGGRGEVVVPREYVREHVELAYGTTAHRAQGQTVDTAHVPVGGGTTRELLYVAATRGREANRLYVDTTLDPDPATGHALATSGASAREVLLRVLTKEGAEASAHETLRREHARVESFATLVAEYETLAQAAVAPRVEAMLRHAGLSADELDRVRGSDAYGPLLAGVREAEACGLKVEAALPALVASRPLDDANDLAAILRDRLARWQGRAASRRATTASGFVAGLVARTGASEDAELARGLREREEAMRARSRELALAAVARGEPWVARLGVPPTDPLRRDRWLAALATVAAYRELCGDHDQSHPIGAGRGGPVTDLHRRRATEAARRAIAIAAEPQHAHTTHGVGPRLAASDDPAPRIGF
jgi:hypothetical protein